MRSTARVRWFVALALPLLGPSAWLACSSFDAAPSPAVADGGPDAALDSATTPDSAVPPDAQPPDASGGCADAGVIANLGCPVPIATDQSEPLHVIVAANKVFWSNFGTEIMAGSVMSASTDGTGATEFVSKSSGYHPSFLAAHGGYVYWGAEAAVDAGSPAGNVYRQPAGGGTVTTFVSPYAPRGIAVNDTHAYWLTWNGQLMAQDLDAGLSPASLRSGGVNLVDIDVDDAGVVYTQSGNAATNPGSVEGRTFDGGPSQPLISDRRAFPWGLRMDDNSVFWAERGDAGALGTINAVGRFASAPILTFCMAQPQPQFLAVDQKHVYFTSRGLGASDGELRRVPKGGGSCELLVSGLARPHGITTNNGSYVYWTTRGDGRVWRMRKP